MCSHTSASMCEQIFHRITIYKFMFYHTGTGSTTFFLKFERFDGVTASNVQIMFSRKSNSKTQTNVFTQSHWCAISPHTRALSSVSLSFEITRSLFSVRCYFSLLTATTTSHFHWILNFEVTEWTNECVADCCALYRVWLVYSRFSNIHTLHAHTCFKWFLVSLTFSLATFSRSFFPALTLCLCVRVCVFECVSKSADDISIWIRKTTCYQFNRIVCMWSKS